MKSNRNYPLLLLSQFLGAFGDNVILAVILGQLTLQKNAGQITDLLLRSRSIMYTSLLFLPYVLLAPMAGYFNDRFPKTTGLTLGNAIKILGTLVCGYSLWGGEWWQIPGYLLVGVGACLYGPAKYGILPEVVPTVRLVKANGTVELLTLLAIITGGVAGAFMVDRFPVKFCYAALLGCYGLALLFNLLMQTTPSGTSVPLNGSLKEFFGHLVNLISGPRLGKILIGTVLFWICGAGLKANFQPWGLNVLQLPNNLQVSLLGLWLSIGIMAGSVLAGFWHKIGDLRRTQIYGFGLASALLLLWSIQPVVGELRESSGLAQLWHAGEFPLGDFKIVPGVILLLMLTGFVAGLFLIPLNAALQAESEPEKLGKTIAVQNFCENVGMLGAAGLVWACVQLKISAGGVFAVLAFLVVGVVFFLRVPTKATT